VHFSIHGAQLILEARCVQRLILFA
jgi:hypothetical protein